MKYWHGGSAVNTFTYISNEILTFWTNLYPGHICTYFQWNIYMLYQLEHIYTYFKLNMNSLKKSASSPHTFAHMSNEILTVGISGSTFTHISNEILTFWNYLYPEQNYTYFHWNRNILNHFIVFVFFKLNIYVFM